jgi:AraC-like DNA-binding protein
VRRAASIDAYRAAPDGACVASRQWIFFTPHRDLTGYTVWGHATTDDFAALTLALDTLCVPGAYRRAFVIDFRLFAGPSPAVFQEAARYTIARHAELGRAISRLAIIHAGGIGGAIIAGFFKVVPAYCPVDTFLDPAEAMTWLGRRDDVAVLDEIDAYRVELAGVSALVREVRTYLDGAPLTTLAQTARRFRLSQRSLQRKLGESGTSFSDELSRARIRVAERLLADPERSVTSIAFDVGCASPQHFSTLFRKVTGETPSAWRSRLASEE